MTAEFHSRFEKARGALDDQIVPENIQEALEEEVQKIVQQWVAHVVQVGAQAKGLWLVDFDNGNGYYCWKYGEKELLYQHSYEAGFAGRTLIEENGE